jgi:proton-dependent oligopeptide transporter, POT family
MASSTYRTTPVKTAGMPPGIPYIVGNEAAERFCYYGINGILVVFMTQHLRDASGQLAVMGEDDAKGWFHVFATCAYALPLLGAFLADALWGKYRTIFWLSLVYCLGCFSLSANSTRLGLAFGLILVSLGAGGIKPCVSANVGDQFGSDNQHLLPRVFTWFYFSINLGSALSTILIPYLLEKSGPTVAFGLPGVFMLMATLVFWLGRTRFVHVPPAGLRHYAREMLDRDNLKSVANLFILVPFAAMFWALWNQNFSSWVLQAEKMDRVIFGQEWLPAQIQTANPVFVLIMLPLFSYVIYPILEKFVTLTPLRKIGLGLFTILIVFLQIAWIQMRIDAGEKPHIMWQILAFVGLTASEVLVSVPHLEFSYTQAPKKMKSLVMCLYLGSIALGNVFTAVVNFWIQNPDGSSKLQGAAYYFFFVKVIAVTTVLYVIVARFYRGKTYAQDEASGT